MHILDQEAQGLADRLRSLSLESRRRILANASRLASEAIADLEPTVSELLVAVLSNYMLSEADVAKARSLAAEADEKYFALQEQNVSPQEWLNWFSKARLLTAMAVGFGGASWSDAADAVYELSKTRDDPSAIFSFVESEINRSL